ncbi:hypothetical protein ACHAWF_009857 [Thalassiosira exigua]
MPRLLLLDAILALALSAAPSRSFAPQQHPQPFSTRTPPSCTWTKEGGGGGGERERPRQRLRMRAAPARLEENAEGPLYVNDRCINCAACSNFAPSVFDRSTSINKHVVSRQPNLGDVEEVERARAALAACPVAAIRVDATAAEGDVRDGRDARRALATQQPDGDAPFPRPLCPLTTDGGEVLDAGVHYLGHHNEASFGAIPYLAAGESPDGRRTTVMVDVPRYGASAVRDVKSLTSEEGPDYLFLTHVDDTADHGMWKAEFPHMKRIFHAGDLGKHNWVGDLTLKDVEVLLPEPEGGRPEGDLSAWDLDGNPVTIEEFEERCKDGDTGGFLVLHTPGHSPGSISLLFCPGHAPLQGRLRSSDGDDARYPRGMLFTGDTYSWTTRDGGHMSGFPRYGNDLAIQGETLKKLARLSDLWDVVAPGHGHPRFYLEDEGAGGEGQKERIAREMREALEELRSHPSW